MSYLLIDFRFCTKFTACAASSVQFTVVSNLLKLDTGIRLSLHDLSIRMIKEKQVKKTTVLIHKIVTTLYIFIAWCCGPWIFCESVKHGSCFGFVEIKWWKIFNNQNRPKSFKILYTEVFMVRQNKC